MKPVGSWGAALHPGRTVAAGPVVRASALLSLGAYSSLCEDRG